MQHLGSVSLPSTSSNCILCEGMAFIGFSRHLISISMSDQPPLLRPRLLISIRRFYITPLYQLLTLFHMFLLRGNFCFAVKLKVELHVRRNIVLTLKKKKRKNIRRKAFELTFRGANWILDVWWWYNWFHSSLWPVMTFLSCQKHCRGLACEFWDEQTIITS